MDTAGNKPNSTIVGNCLACHGLVRIPATSKSNVTVRCPHCSESFQLKQIIEDSIPELEIVSEPPAEDVIPHFDRAGVRPTNPSQQPREKFVVPSQLSNGAKRHHRRRGSKGNSRNSSRENQSRGRENQSDYSAVENSGPEHNALKNADAQTDDGLSFAEIDFSNETQTADNSSFSSVESESRSKRESSRPVHPSQRSRRHRPVAKTNSTMEVVKVVIGGVMAFPIAYLLLLWLFNQDPFNLGPKMGGIIPFAVPAEFREQLEVSVPLDRKPDSVDTKNAPVLLPINESHPLAIPDLDPDKNEFGDNFD